MAATDLTAGAQPGPVRLRAEGRRWGELVVKIALGLCALVSVATTIGIIIALVVPSVEFFREVSILDFFSGDRWAPLFEPASFGVQPLLVGTLVVTLWACVIALPCGLGAAIYMSEYARPRVRNILKPALETLAGIPTVVFGFFALTFFTPLLQDIGLGVNVFNVLAAGLVVGVMLIPVVASVSEDAMSAVPQDLRDGAYCARRNAAPGFDPHRRPRRHLRDHRQLRARDLARGGRDDDRAHRRGRPRPDHLRPA